MTCNCCGLKATMAVDSLVAFKTFWMTFIVRWAKPEVGGCRLHAAVVPDANFARLISLSMSSSASSLYSFSEVFSGAKTPDANLGGVQEMDLSRDKIPRSKSNLYFPYSSLPLWMANFIYSRIFQQRLVYSRLFKLSPHPLHLYLLPDLTSDSKFFTLFHSLQLNIFIIIGCFHGLHAR